MLILLMWVKSLDKLLKLLQFFFIFVFMKTKYHLTPRPNKQARNKIWYVWYWDELQGKRIHRSTGERLKSEALKKVRQWEEEDRLRMSGDLSSLAANFFVPGECPYLDWKKELKQRTISEHRRNLTDYILKEYGGRVPASITAPEVEKWLKTTYPKKSGSWKINLLNTFRIILTELQRARVVVYVPKFRSPPKVSTRADAFTGEELKKLFPEDEIDLALLWTRRRKNQQTGKLEVDTYDKAGLLFGLMFKVMLQAGMRPGEVRALTVDCVYLDFSGIHIARQIDSEGELTYLKKAGAEDRRERLVKIPKDTMEQLTGWMNSQGSNEGFIFTYNDKPVRTENLEGRFDIGVKNAQVATEGRKIVPYSLRFTYRSRVEGFMQRREIMDAMGHKSDEMSLHYLHVHPEQFRAMEIEQHRIEEIWG